MTSPSRASTSSTRQVTRRSRRRWVRRTSSTRCHGPRRRPPHRRGRSPRFSRLGAPRSMTCDSSSARRRAHAGSIRSRRRSCCRSRPLRPTPWRGLSSSAPAHAGSSTAAIEASSSSSPTASAGHSRTCARPRPRNDGPRRWPSSTAPGRSSTPCPTGFSPSTGTGG